MGARLLAPPLIAWGLLALLSPERAWRVEDGGPPPGGPPTPVTLALTRVAGGIALALAALVLAG